MSTDLSIEDFDDDTDASANIDIDDETGSRAGQAKASLMKRRLIDDILEQKRMAKLLADFDDDDLDDDLDND